MVTPGHEAKKKVKPANIGKNKKQLSFIFYIYFILWALATITALSRTCPPALAGIVCE